MWKEIQHANCDQLPIQTIALVVGTKLLSLTIGPDGLSIKPGAQKALEIRMAPTRLRIFVYLHLVW